MVTLIEPEIQPRRTQQEIIENLIVLAKKEKQNGNSAITQDKLIKLELYLETKQKVKQAKPTFNFNKVPAPKPKYSPLFNKFSVKTTKPEVKAPAKRQVRSPYRKFSLARVEGILVEILEGLANILDNLHLLSNMPMFPQHLVKLLKQTNKIWVVILIFLIKKTLTQLLNVRRKERKVKLELAIIKASTPDTKESSLSNDITKKYKKVLKDLNFDKLMLYLELVGNFLDMGFNVIELAKFAVPGWFMNTLNVTSMLMTIYRMNKDDEYVNDDITEDLI